MLEREDRWSDAIDTSMMSVASLSHAAFPVSQAVIATATNTITAQINLAAGTRPTAVAITPTPTFAGEIPVFSFVLILAS